MGFAAQERRSTHPTCYVLLRRVGKGAPSRRAHATPFGRFSVDAVPKGGGLLRIPGKRLVCLASLGTAELAIIQPKLRQIYRDCGKMGCTLWGLSWSDRYGLFLLLF
jgi:hypothetical protein